MVDRLAEGGMGEVYKARDTRLDRTVALKVLPAHLSNDEELRRRFELEARAISAISHPNICTLFDIGSHEGREFLVMEYLQGQTLAERVTQGPLPLDEVIRIGTQMADAMEKAHRKGIIHRDLKPSNIVLTRDGAKLLDFGLAKWMPSAGTFLGGSNDATERHPLTTQGTLLGTIPYMAPEQLEGKTIDPRTDIFALGAVLYEMATGQRAFNAASNASLIAAIMREDPPPPSRVRDLTPRGLDAIITTCLEKDPDERFQSAHDVKLALQLVAGGAGETAVAAPRKPSRLLPLALGALALALLVAGAAMWTRSDAPRSPYRFGVHPPNGSTFPSLGEGGGFALSPDGRRLVFEATTPEGRTYLWMRALDSEEPKLLDGTEGGEYPFWSPDGRAIAFFADGKLKRHDLPDGPTQTICDAPAGRGGAWSKDGVILLAPGSTGGLYRVDATGGTPQAVTQPDDETYSHRWPVFLDGERFLFTVQGQSASKVGVFAGSLQSKEVTRILPSSLSVAFAAPDRLYHVRDHVLVRQRFDVDDLQLVGEPQLVADEIYFYSDRGYVPATAASDGTVAYRRNGVANMRIAWHDREGRRLAAFSEMGEYEGITISPDGSRVAFGYFDPKESLNHIAIAAMSNNVPRRFTFTRGNQYSPVWSPDLTRLVFSDDASGVDTLTAKPLAGTGNEQALIKNPPRSIFALCWSPDGSTILYRAEDAKGGYDVEALPIGGKPGPYLDGPSDETHAQFSPDGRFVAYTSTESERPEVYVQPFPATGAKWQVSTAGGEQPRWRRDGKELYYLAPDRRLMSVRIRVSGAFDENPPEPLFATHIPFGDVGLSHAYDVSPDGTRFVIAAADPLTPQSPITVVTGK
ncbi:MAG TPA: protein kinase [Thermoanaerobaculia bacterium]